MDNNDSTKILLAINDKLIVHGQRVFLELRKVSGCGKGKKSMFKVVPGTACYVVKTQDSYRLLNAKDPRVNSIISSYDGATQVEFILIDADRKDEVGFIAGDLIPQQTPEASFESFIKGVAASSKKQNLILEYFCPDKSKSHSTLSFNATSFLSLLGKNTPSRTTVNRFLSQKPIKQPVITFPNQIDTKPSYSISENENSEDDKTKHQEPVSQEPVYQGPLGEGESNHNLQFDISFELKAIWNNHADSDFSIDQIIQILRKEPINYQNVFKNKLNLEPTSAEFKKFVSSVNKYMAEH